MITIELSQAETATLIDMIEACITDLHSEIHHTDSFEYKEDLRKRKEILVNLRNQLQRSYKIAE